MEVSRLRAILEPRLLGLKNAGRHEDLPSICQTLGLPQPGDEGTKQERIKASLLLWARLQVVKLGTRINRINIVEQPLPEEARLEGIKLFRDNVLRLQDVLGCDLSAWLR